MGEWLRCQADLADTGDWIAEVTRANLRWTTEEGLYRDPNDPATYDLSVRQNWSELLACGYDGDGAHELDNLLERGGPTTLKMISPLGWAPFGGRSNLFVHNEAMVTYICECEAKRWHARGWDERAASFLHLFPAFHRTFATCGDTQVQIDTRAQLTHDATGVGRIHRAGVPPALGMSCSVAAEAAYIIHRGTGGHAVALGPAWQRSGGRWLSLAGCSDEIIDVTCEREQVGEDEVRWTIVQQLRGLDVDRVVQHYALSSGRLRIQVELHGNADRVALEVPCLSFDGQDESTIQVGADGVTVDFQEARLTARTPEAERIRIGDSEHASRQAVYRVATLERRGRSLVTVIQLG